MLVVDTHQVSESQGAEPSTGSPEETPAIEGMVTIRLEVRQGLIPTSTHDPHPSPLAGKIPVENGPP
jgi:hypothetical protein